MWHNIHSRQKWVEPLHSGFLSVSVITTMTKSNTGKERIIWAYIVRLESFLEASQGWDSSWNWRKSQREILLIGLVSGLCSDRLCIQHNPKFLRMVLTVDWASSYQSSTKHMFLIHAHKQIWPMQFFSWCFFLIGDSRMCQVDNEN